jgi:hypothetical protein
VAKLRITYRTDRKPDEVTLGAFSQIAAKRRYGLEATKSEDPEVALFGCFVELEGPATAKDPDAFDAWLMNVETFSLAEEVEDPEDPTPAETPSSDTSPESPPTSD